MAYIRIQSVYLHAKQFTPNESFNWWVDGENKSKIITTVAYIRIQFYLHPKQSTPDRSFNGWVDEENKSKIVKTAAYIHTVSLLTG